MSFLKPLPQYRCHKVVSALQVKMIVPNPRGFELHFTDESFAPRQVDTLFMRKHEVMPGCYMVMYDDGYTSISPQKAFEEGYTLLTGAPEFSNPPELSIVWHDSPEAIHRAFLEPVAAGEGMTYEQFVAESYMCGQDADGNECEIESGAELEGMRLQGCWGFLDENTNTVHAWADPGVDRALLLHMLAHEVGHATGTAHPDELQEEFRAEQFGAVAAMAFRFMDQFELMQLAVNELPAHYHSFSATAYSGVGADRVCQGRNCQSVNGTPHSPECIEDHERAYTGEDGPHD